MMTASWLLAAGVIASFVLLCLTLILHIWLLKARIRVRLQQCMVERERTARESHDNFLQCVQGLVLSFHAAMEKIPRSEPARELMSNALKRADDILIEGIDHLAKLGNPAREYDYLPRALQGRGTQLARIFGTSFCLTVEGIPNPLHPRIAEQIELISNEALNNAFRHSLARRVDVQVQYAPDSLSLSVSDDGGGFATVARRDETSREYPGLTRMRDWARRMRAQLEVTSRPGYGTAVYLNLQGAIAFECPVSVPRYWLWLLLGRG
jgi:signal transduction histidine kinase